MTLNLQALRELLFTQDNFGKGTEALKNLLLSLGFCPIVTQEERSLLKESFVSFPFTESLNPEHASIYERAKLFVEAWSWFNASPVESLRDLIDFELPSFASPALLEVKASELLDYIRAKGSIYNSMFLGIPPDSPTIWLERAINLLAGLVLAAASKYGIVATTDAFDPKSLPDTLILTMDFTRGLDRIVPWMDIRIPLEHRRAFMLMEIYQEALKLLGYPPREIKKRLSHFYDTGSFNEILEAVTEAYRQKKDAIAKAVKKNPNYILGKDFLIPALWTAAVMNSDIELVFLPFVFNYLISIQNVGFIPFGLQYAEALRGASATRNISLATRSGTFFNTGLRLEILKEAINLMPYALMEPRFKENPLVRHILEVLSQRLDEIASDPGAEPFDVQDFLIAGLQGFANFVKELWENRFVQEAVTGIYLDPKGLEGLSQNLGEFYRALTQSKGVFFVPYQVKDETGRESTRVMLIVPSHITPIFTSFQSWLPSGQNPPIEFSVEGRVFRTNLPPTIIASSEVADFLYSKTKDVVISTLIGDILGRAQDGIYIFEMGVILPKTAEELSNSVTEKGFLEGTLTFWTVNPNYSDREFSLVTAVVQDAGTPWKLPKSEIPEQVKARLESLGPIYVDYGPNVIGISPIIFSFDPEQRAKIVQEFVDSRYPFLPEAQREKQTKLLIQVSETHSAKALRFLYILSSYKPEIWRCPGYLPIPQFIPPDIEENAPPEFLETYRKAARKAYQRLLDMYQDPAYTSMKRNWIELMKVLLAPVFSPDLVEHFASAVGPGESIWDAFVDNRVQTYGTAKPFVKAVVEAWDEAAAGFMSTPLLTKTWFQQYWDAARSTFESFMQHKSILEFLEQDLVFWLEFAILDPTEALANLQNILKIATELMKEAEEAQQEGGS
jgi:hypothetical protein